MLLAAGIAAGLLLALWPGHPRQTVTPLALQLAQDGEDRLKITWDQASAALQSGGFLSIQDGGETKQVPLTPEDVANGSVLYRAHSDDVRVQLQVQGQTPQRSAPLHWVDGARPHLLSMVPPAEVQPPKRSVTTVSIRMMPPAPVKPKRVFHLPTLTAFAPPPANRSEYEPPNILATPETPLSLFWRLPETNVRPFVEPVKPVTPAVFVPARPVHRVIPALEESRRWLPPVLRVHVRIDERGLVTEATIPPKQGPLPFETRRAVLNAASQWRFTPALWNGRAIVSEHQLVFQLERR